MTSKETAPAAPGGPSRLAIFHYHLHPGGVTSVIILGVKALLEFSSERFEEIILVSGSGEHLDALREELAEPAHRAGVRLTLTVLPEIGYGESSGPPAGSRTEEEALARRLLDSWGGAVWWVHNYHLGKNPLFTQTLLRIIRDRPEQPLLLQIHDFPESGRFENLKHLRNILTLPVYPVSPNLRYLTISEADREILIRAGIPREAAVLLANPVELPADGSGRTGSPAGVPENPDFRVAINERIRKEWAPRFPGYRPEGSLALCPVRTIRRKNILEAGLLARLSPEPLNLAVTLPGVSRQEAPYSRLVESLFYRGIIPGIWGTGTAGGAGALSLEELAGASDLILSSSVQEGFGYLFLHAGLWNRPLLARHLEVLDEILPALPELPRRIYRRIPVSWPESGRRRTAAAYEARFRELAPFLDAALTEPLRSWLEDYLNAGAAEFSWLPADLQVEVLTAAAEDPGFLEAIRELNRDLLEDIRVLLSAPLPSPAGRQKTLKSADAVFGSRRFAFLLEGILDGLTAPEKPAILRGGAPADERRVLEAFNRPENHRLLLQPYHGGKI